MDNEKLVTLGRQAVDAIQCVTPSRSYTIGSAGAIFYISGGASDDYAKVCFKFYNSASSVFSHAPCFGCELDQGAT